jgi:nucleotide-binding universal stress UspA family protein
MKRIVVGYDGSEGSRRALDRAAVLAHAFDCEVIVATVDEYVPSLVATGAVTDLAGMSRLESGDIQEATRQNVERLSHEAQELLLAENVPSRLASTYGVSTYGSADHELAEIAEQSQADLIVVGAGDPGFLSRMIFGSTGASLARHAPCDVLIVHP